MPEGAEAGLLYQYSFGLHNTRAVTGPTAHTLFLVLVELDSRLLKEIDRVLRVHVFVETELEVELVGESRRTFPVLVHESQPQLKE